MYRKALTSDSLSTTTFFLDKDFPSPPLTHARGRMRETRCGTFELWSLPRSAASPADACGLPGAYGRRPNLCHGAIDPADGCLACGAGVQLHLAAVRCTEVTGSNVAP